MTNTLDGLLEALLNADGEVRQKLAEANAAALRSEAARARASQQAGEALRRVRNLELALKHVIQLQERHTTTDND